MTQWADTSNSSRSDVAKQEASGVADSAGQAASQVAGTAQDQVKEVAAEAKTQAKDLGREVQSQVNEQAGTQRDRLVGVLRSLGDELQQIASGKGVESGVATDVAQQVADRTRSAAGFLDGKEPAELLSELSRYARQRPGAFLIGAAVAGLAAGRLTRGLTAATSDSTSATPELAPYPAADTLSGGPVYSTPAVPGDVDPGFGAAPSYAAVDPAGAYGNPVGAAPLPEYGTEAESAPFEQGYGTGRPTGHPAEGPRQ